MTVPVYQPLEEWAFFPRAFQTGLFMSDAREITLMLPSQKITK